MTRRKPFVAWVSVDPDNRGGPILSASKERALYLNRMTVSGKGKLVKLTEADPLAKLKADVVREACQLAHAYHEADYDSVVACIETFKRAVERLQRKGKSK